jgi:signal transduction histidine kinase
MNANTQPRVQSRLLRAFVLQLALISFATVTGVMAASLVAEQILVKQALSGEAEYFWQHRENKPDFPIPNTMNLQSFLHTDDHSALPFALQNLPQGQQRVMYQGDELIAFVSSRGEETLTLLFQDDTVSNLGFYFGVVPLTLVLLVMYALAYLTYVLSKRAVSPIAKLAETIENFDFSARDANELDLNKFTGPHNSETLVLADALQHFIERTNESIERERTFARYASHELRTPLAVIDGSISSLSLLDLEEKPARAVNRIKRASRHMLDLTSTLLLLARDKKNGEHLNQVIIPVVVDDLLLEIGEVVPTSRLTITHHKEFMLTVMASEASVRIVIGNILRNACLYTQEGTIDIHTTDDSITITDNGPGLSDEDKRKVFDPFFRVENRISGSGLGLSLVKNTCDTYGWTIEIESELGRGSSFTVRFGDSVTGSGHRM